MVGVFNLETGHDIAAIVIDEQDLIDDSFDHLLCSCGLCHRPERSAPIALDAILAHDTEKSGIDRRTFPLRFNSPSH